MRVVIFRLFNTVGPRQTGRYGMVLPRFVSQALAGEPLTVYGDGQQSRCFLHVPDAVEAILKLEKCEEAAGQVFNVGSQEEVSIKQLAEMVLAEVGAPATRIRRVPYSEAYTAGFEDTPKSPCHHEDLRKNRMASSLLDSRCDPGQLGISQIRDWREETRGLLWRMAVKHLPHNPVPPDRRPT